MEYALVYTAYACTITLVGRYFAHANIETTKPLPFDQWGVQHPLTINQTGVWRRDSKKMWFQKIKVRNPECAMFCRIIWRTSEAIWHCSGGNRSSKRFLWFFPFLLGRETRRPSCCLSSKGSQRKANKGGPSDPIRLITLRNRWLSLKHSNRSPIEDRSVQCYRWDIGLAFLHHSHVDRHDLFCFPNS